MYDGFTVRVGDFSYSVFVRPIICTGDTPATLMEYMITTMNVDTSKLIFDLVKTILTEIKENELRKIFSKFRKAGNLKGYSSKEKIEGQIKKQLNAIKVLSYDKSSTLVSKWTSDFVKVTEYKACSLGCTLFKLTDLENAVCSSCENEFTRVNKTLETSNKDKEKFREEMKLLAQKKQTVYYVDIKEQICSMFVNENMRDLLRYGANYVATPGVYKDVFDGETIQRVTEGDAELQVSLSNYVLYVGIMQDGFTTSINHSESTTHTLFQIVCYSVSLAFRYRNSMKIICLISPGPKKPIMKTYIKPMLEELEELYEGFTVKVGDSFFNVFVRPIICTGDTPAIADIFQLKSSGSYYPCRFCNVLGTYKGSHMCKQTYDQRRIAFPVEPLKLLPIQENRSSRNKASKKRKLNDSNEIFVPHKVVVRDPEALPKGIYLLQSESSEDRDYMLCTKPESYYIKSQKNIAKTIKDAKGKCEKAHILDETNGVKGQFAFASVPSFMSMRQSGLDDLHFVNRGMALILYDLFTTDKYRNKNMNSTKLDFDRVPMGVNLSHYIYPFELLIPNKYDDIKTFINKEIIEARNTVPPYMSGSYLTVNSTIRACDWEDVLLRVIPSTVVPIIVSPEARAALCSLVLALSISLQWYISEEQLELMDDCFKKFPTFLMDCVNHDSLDPCVMTVTTHYCLHVKSVIKECGPLRIISARCLERQINVSKKLIRSRANPGINSQNACVNMVKANVLKTILPSGMLRNQGHDFDILTVLEDELVPAPFPDTFANYDIHVSLPTANELQFGRRSFSIDHKKLFVMSSFDRTTFWYTMFHKFDDKKLLGCDLLKNIKYIYLPDLFHDYLESIGECVQPNSPLHVMLFEEVEMTMTYCLPSTTKEFGLTDIKKKFKIESQLSIINKEDGGLNKGDSRRSRFVIYKKQSATAFPPFTVVSPFLMVNQEDPKLYPRVYGFESRGPAELVPLESIFHLVGLHRTFPCVGSSSGASVTISTAMPLEYFNVFWPRSSLGNCLPYKFYNDM